MDTYLFEGVTKRWQGELLRRGLRFLVYGFSMIPSCRIIPATFPARGSRRLLGLSTVRRTVNERRRG